LTLTTLVLDAEAKAAPSVVRALGAAGQRVFAAGADARPPAGFSRYVSRRLTHPDSAVDPAGFVAWVDRAMRDWRPDCVLPLTECSIMALHRDRDRFGGRTALALPPPEATEIAFDKARVLSLAESLGVDVPATWRPGSAAEAADLSERLVYPVYVKARQSYRSDESPACYARGRFAHRPADCRAAWTELHAAVPLPVLQEAVPGPVVSVCGAWDGGRPVCRFCYVAGSAWPLSGGASVWRRSIPPGHAPVAQAERLLATLRWTGPAHVQFIRDSRDGRFRLLEINGRFWGSVDAAHHCGVPVAVTAVELAMGLHPRSDLRYRTGVRSRWIEGDLKRLFATSFQQSHSSREALQMPRLRQCLLDLALGFAPMVHQDDFYPDDPLPGAATVWRPLGRAFGLARSACRKACFGKWRNSSRLKRPVGLWNTAHADSGTSDVLA
jgi:predicted ATP-grasp superfamily ATP-dependent carboligase